MLKSIALWNYGSDQIANAQKFKELGFEAFSFLGRLFDQQTPEEDAAVAECMKRLHAPMTIHHRFPNPSDAEAVSIFFRNMEHILSWQKRYGLLTGLTFDFGHSPETLCPLLGKVIQMFRGSGVFLACEDHPMDEKEMEYFAPYITPEDNFGILIDCGHMHLRHTSAGKSNSHDVAEALMHLPLPLIEVHLSGNHGLRDEHLPPEEGTFPMDGFVRGLRALGFDGLCTIERVPREEEYQTSILKAKNSIEWFFAHFRE